MPPCWCSGAVGVADQRAEADLAGRRVPHEVAVVGRALDEVGRPRSTPSSTWPSVTVIVSPGMRASTGVLRVSEPLVGLAGARPEDLAGRRAAVLGGHRPADRVDADLADLRRRAVRRLPGLGLQHAGPHPVGPLPAERQRLVDGRHEQRDLPVAVEAAGRVAVHGRRDPPGALPHLPAQRRLARDHADALDVGGDRHPDGVAGERSLEAEVEAVARAVGVRGKQITAWFGRRRASHTST